MFQNRNRSHAAVLHVTHAPDLVPSRETRDHETVHVPAPKTKTANRDQSHRKTTAIRDRRIATKAWTIRFSNVHNNHFHWTNSVNIHNFFLGCIVLQYA